MSGMGLPLTNRGGKPGANLSAGGMALPPPGAGKPEGEMTLLERKQNLFRERMAKRNLAAEADQLKLDLKQGIQAQRGPASTERTGRSSMDERGDSSSEDEEDEGVQAEDVALVEAQTAELAGKAGLAAQREAWAEVMEK